MNLRLLRFTEIYKDLLKFTKIYLIKIRCVIMDLRYTEIY